MDITDDVVDNSTMIEGQSLITLKELRSIYASGQTSGGRAADISVCKAALYFSSTLQVTPCQIGWRVVIDHPDKMLVLCTSRAKNKPRIFKTLDAVDECLSSVDIVGYKVFSCL